MNDIDMIKSCLRQRQVKRILYVGCCHRGTELPADNVAREVIQNGRQVYPDPANDLEVGARSTRPSLPSVW